MCCAVLPAVSMLLALARLADELASWTSREPIRGGAVTRVGRLGASEA